MSGFRGKKITKIDNLVTPVTRYPYPLGDITVKQAVTLIAAVVHPDENKREARKRIRERIRYAMKKGHLPNTGHIEVPNFFEWALKIPEWSAVAKIDGLPREPISGCGFCELPAPQCEGYGFSIPDNPQTLRDEFCRLAVDKIKLAQEAANLRTRIDNREAEIRHWREKALSRRNKASEAGKKGGRGNLL